MGFAGGVQGAEEGSVSPGHIGHGQPGRGCPPEPPLPGLGRAWCPAVFQCGVMWGGLRGAVGSKLGEGRVFYPRLWTTSGKSPSFVGQGGEILQYRLFPKTLMVKAAHLIFFLVKFAFFIIAWVTLYFLSLL